LESGSNIILIGATGAGKSTTGRLLARLVGYGFIDLDEFIEARGRATVQALYEAKGEEGFRALEREVLLSLRGLRSHVLAVGGGAVMDDDNWQWMQEMGATVWINTPAEEIARRLAADAGELHKRPLLAEVMSHEDAATRHRLLSERIKALIGNRVGRYKEARLAVSDSFSTPETTAHLVKDLLVREQILTLSKEHCPFDRWRSL
jgi:shikimate kinase